MGLLAAFAVLALAPQDPTPSPAPRPATVLAAQEERGEAADAGVLAQLAQGDDEAVAARAAWALGRTKGGAALDGLQAVVQRSRHAEARLQAMHVLAERAQPEASPTALAAATDADARVRATAARFLGAVKPAGAIPALTAMVERAAQQANGAPSPDVPAALLALRDLAAAEQVLQVARAIDAANLPGAGSALQFLCQELVPSLPSAAKMATLQHLVANREPAVRQFALTQLGSLRDGTALPWVAARAAIEQGDLKALADQVVAVLATPPPSDDPLVQGRRNLRTLAWRAASWWRHSDDMQKAMVVGIPCALATLLVVAIVLGRRRRAAAVAAVAAAAAAPIAYDTDDAAFDDQTAYGDEGEVAAAADQAMADADEVAVDDADAAELTERDDVVYPDEQPADDDLAATPTRRAGAGSAR
ncbi:MAG: HEAT repeat domain-containing protein [Planctomycetota bacterium]